jgi:predicted ABC-type ATPase
MSETSWPPPTPTIDKLPDAVRDALGQILAEQRRQWRRERELMEAQAQTFHERLRAESIEFEKKLSQMVADRLAMLRDGAPGEPGPPGPPGPAGPPGAPGSAANDILIGTGAPRMVSRAGAIYLDRATGDLYQSREFSPDETRDYCQDPETGLLCGSEPSGGSDTSGGGGAKPAGGKTEGSASDLAKPVSKTTDQVIASVPGSKPKIDATRAKLANAVATDAPVAHGGHKQADGSYTAARVAVQQNVVRSIMTPEAIAAATPKEGEKPTLHILGGRGGSGKSFFTSKNGTIDKSKFLYLNNDDIKGKLPEYRGWNAALVHEESSHIGDGMERAVRDAKLNVIIDGTMKSAGMTEKRIADFKAAGYKIIGHYMYTSPENSATRALERFMRGGETGRFVPPEYSLGSTTNEASFDRVKDKMDDWEIYDNNGSAPKFHARKKK